MKNFTRFLLSGWLCFGLAACSASTDTTEDVSKEEINTETSAEKEVSESEREVAFKIGMSTDSTVAYFVTNDLSEPIQKMYLQKSGDSGKANVLTQNLESGKTLQWNLETEKDTIYSLSIDTAEHSYTFNDIDFSDINPEEDLTIKTDMDETVLEYTSAIDNKEVITVAAVASTVENAVDEELKVDGEDEAMNAEGEQIYQDQTTLEDPSYDYDESTLVEQYPDTYYDYDTGYDAGYDNSYDAGYDYSYDSGYDNSYDYSDQYYTEPDTGYDAGTDYELPSQSQEGCLGEDALIN